MLNCKCSSGVTLSVKAVQPVPWQINSSPLPLSTTVSLVGRVYIISLLMAWSPTLVIWGFCWPSLSADSYSFVINLQKSPVAWFIVTALFKCCVLYVWVFSLHVYLCAMYQSLQRSEEDTGPSKTGVTEVVSSRVGSGN